MQRWNNFDIELVDHDVVGDVATARVRVVRSPAGEQRDALSVTVPPLLQTATTQLERADIALGDLIALGEALAEVLLPAGVGTLFESSLNRLEADEGLRLRILMRPLPLAELPWELIYRRRGDDGDSGGPERGFLALDRRVSIVRYEPVSRPAESWPPLGDARLSIAMLLADPEIPGWAKLDLDSEVQAVESALHDEPDVALSVHRHANDRTLNDVLDARPHVFHFAGHGRFRLQPSEQFGVFTGHGELLFETAERGVDPVSARELAAKMRGSGVRLAVLNSCESARRDEVNAFTGVAPTLVRDGVPAVVAMQYRIRDSQALIFARRLYHNLAAHQSIDSAVAAARLAMFEAAAGRGGDFAVPVLYLRSDQAVLFPDPATAMTVSAARRRFTVRGVGNLTLAVALVFVLAFLYLRHVEPRLPFGTVIGGVLAAATVAAVAFLGTVAGDTFRAVALEWLRRRTATGVLAGALLAGAAALALTPAPIAIRVLPGKTLLSLLPAASVAQPLQTYRLTVSGSGGETTALDFRKCGVALAASRAMAARLSRRHGDVIDAGMRTYLEHNGLVGSQERFTGLWRPTPDALGMRGLGGDGELTLRLRQGETLVSCQTLSAGDLTQEMNVIFMENGDECQ